MKVKMRFGTIGGTVASGAALVATGLLAARPWFLRWGAEGWGRRERPRALS
jgi:hypothetical protein